MTYEQFRDLCIMCGTDYNKNIERVGPETAYNALIEHNTSNIDEQNDNLESENLLDDIGNRYPAHILLI